MINKKIREILEKIVKNLYRDIEIPDFVVEYPKQREYGDYASNVAMVLAGKLNKNPMDIAEEMKDSLIKNGSDIFNKITVAKPGFINFEVSSKVLEDNLREILSRKDKFGASDLGKGKVVVIDYSSPNIAKPMHVGHLRSTIIGQSLYNIYKFLGYKVIGDNHIGDWGTQFGKLIYAYKRWGNKKEIDKNPIKEMTELYVKFHKEVVNNKNLEELARKEVKKLQEKDNENLKIWKFLVKESLKDFSKVYKTLNVKFDYMLGESFYNDMLESVVSESLDKRVASKSEGAVIINLDKFNLPPFLIKKKDGAYLYATTDLAAAKYRKEKFKADKILYVVSNEQALHFQQLFSALELLGWCRGVELRHIKFGMVLADSGKKFSTRKGDSVMLSDLINRSVEISGKIVEEKSPGLSRKDKSEIAKAIGIGAIKYNDLSQNRMTDINFNWDKMLSFDGNSSPYLQYTYARINSLEKKYYGLYKLDRLNIFGGPNFDLLNTRAEKDIMRQLVKFPEIVEQSAKENTPHLIALYIYELASLYNSFYNAVPVLKSEKRLAKARVFLSKSVAIVIKNGLGLLGIKVVGRM
jgi:arginyl-tRNA synthetase